MAAIIIAFLYREVAEAYFALHAENNSVLACLLILSDMCLMLPFISEASSFQM